MKFECGDLERAFANSDLMPEARAHVKTCAACRREFQLWTDISSTAGQLHEEWATPELWPQIRQALQTEQRMGDQPPWKSWKTWLVAATLLLTAGAALLVFERQQQAPTLPQTAASQDQDFLTEQALSEVEKTEAAYRKSIDHLTQVAQPRLEDNSSAAAVNAREKLLMLDAAIADTRVNVLANRFNLHLQTTLAGLYREKQQTLKELLTSAQDN